MWEAFPRISPLPLSREQRADEGDVYKRQLSRGQAVALRRHLKQHDPHAFMLIENSSEIFGKVFLRA